jgi:transcriptional regulator with XRE-family HTH domain
LALNATGFLAPFFPVAFSCTQPFVERKRKLWGKLLGRGYLLGQRNNPYLSSKKEHTMSIDTDTGFAGFKKHEVIQTGLVALLARTQEQLEVTQAELAATQTKLANFAKRQLPREVVAAVSISHERRNAERHIASKNPNTYTAAKHSQMVAEGQQLRALREARGWTQKQLAARLGLSPWGDKQIKTYEVGSVSPRPARLAAITRLLAAEGVAAVTQVVDTSVSLTGPRSKKTFAVKHQMRADGLRLKALREARGWTQRQLAVAIGLDDGDGGGRSQIQCYESGRKRPKAERAAQLLAVLAA